MSRYERAVVPGGRADGLEPYRRLAARVIAQALHDLLTPGESVAHQSAIRFFRGSRMLDHWCQLAQIDSRGLGVRLQELRRSASSATPRIEA